MLVLELFHQNVLSMNGEAIGQAIMLGIFGFELHVTVAAAAAFLVMADFDGSHRAKSATYLFEIFGIQSHRQVAHE